VRIEYALEAIRRMEESLDVTCGYLSLEDREIIVEEVFRKAESLLSHPRSGQVEPLMGHLRHEYRRVVAGCFKIIYRIQGEVILVTDIFDSRQDPDRMRG